jgi:hypothetical protein
MGRADADADADAEVRLGWDLSIQETRCILGFICVSTSANKRDGNERASGVEKLAACYPC